MELIITSTLSPVACTIECHSVAIADALASQLEDHETADLVLGHSVIRSYSMLNGVIVAFTPDMYSETLSLVKRGH